MISRNGFTYSAAMRALPKTRACARLSSDLVLRITVARLFVAATDWCRICLLVQI